MTKIFIEDVPSGSIPNRCETCSAPISLTTRRCTKCDCSFEVIGTNLYKHVEDGDNLTEMRNDTI